MKSTTNRAWWAVLVLVLGAAGSLAGCATQRESAPAGGQRFEFTRPEMGVPFRIVLYAPDAASAEVAANESFARIEQLNDILSDYDTDSELNRLSRLSSKDARANFAEFAKSGETLEEFLVRTSGKTQGKRSRLPVRRRPSARADVPDAAAR